MLIDQIKDSQSTVKNWTANPQLLLMVNSSSSKPEGTAVEVVITVKRTVQILPYLGVS
jgi:hypothetical protein